MTYDTTADRPSSAHNGNDWTSWATTPGFNPGKAVAVIAGLAIFPPLGIAALVYFIWATKRARYAEGGEVRGWRGGCGARRNYSGNRAFDEHRKLVLDELEAEREAFFAFRQEERMKKDRAEFDAFRGQAASKSSD